MVLNIDFSKEETKLVINASKMFIMLNSDQYIVLYYFKDVQHSYQLGK